MRLYVGLIAVSFHLALLTILVVVVLSLSPPHELPPRDPIQSAVDESFGPKILLCTELG